jgi:LacI family transcriptional regulator
MVSRDEVARRAGVSTATVSRVFNTPERVKSDRRERVLEVARSLGYQPNKFASALRRANNGAILLLTPRDVFAPRIWKVFSWHWADSLRGVQGVIQDSLYHLHFHEVEELDRVKQLLSDDWAGVLTLNLENEKILCEIEDSGVPWVHCGTLCGERRGPGAPVQVLGDNRLGARMVATHLAERGIQNPVMLSCDWDIAHVKERETGFLEIYPGATLLRGGYDDLWGEEVVERLLPDLRQGDVDCLFPYNSWVGMGVMRQLLRKGVQVPEDLSVITYDHSPLLQAFPVSVFTVDHGVERVSRMGMRSLLTLLEQGEMPHLVQRIAPELVPGASVG